MVQIVYPRAGGVKVTPQLVVAGRTNWPRAFLISQTAVQAVQDLERPQMSNGGKAVTTV